MKYSLLILTFLFSFTVQFDARAGFANRPLRSPIRTWIRDGVCLCPYDQLARGGLNLMSPRGLEICGGRSEHSRYGGGSPACFYSDIYSNPNALTEAFNVQSACMSDLNNCYLDLSRRYY